MEYEVNTANKTIRFISGNVNELYTIIEQFKDYSIISAPPITYSYPNYPTGTFFNVDNVPLINGGTTTDLYGNQYVTTN